MRIEFEVFYDNLNRDGGRESDELIRAIDEAMGGANWESANNSRATNRHLEASRGRWIATK